MRTFHRLRACEEVGQAAQDRSSRRLTLRAASMASPPTLSAARILVAGRAIATCAKKFNSANNAQALLVAMNIGFGPNDRPSDCIVTIAAAANGVGLCFVRGASLPDPDKVLQGSGKQTRFVRLSSAGVLDQPAVQALLTAAAERAQSPVPAAGRGKLIIRSVSAKQRPRRKKPRKT